MANKYVTEEVRKQIGKVAEPRTYEVERGAIRRFAEAIGDPNPLFSGDQEARHGRFGGIIAPPTFCRSMMAAFPEIKLDIPGNRGLDGGSDWEYLEPIRPGDRITVQCKIADIRESEGRLGAMVFTTIETSFSLLGIRFSTDSIRVPIEDLACCTADPMLFSLGRGWITSLMRCNMTSR